MTRPIRTAESIDEILANAKPRPQSFDWPMVLQEAARFVAFLAGIALIFGICLTRGGF